MLISAPPARPPKGMSAKQRAVFNAVTRPVSGLGDALEDDRRQDRVEEARRKSCDGERRKDEADGRVQRRNEKARKAGQEEGHRINHQARHPLADRRGNRRAYDRGAGEGRRTSPRAAPGHGLQPVSRPAAAPRESLVQQIGDRHHGDDADEHCIAAQKAPAFLRSSRYEDARPAGIEFRARRASPQPGGCPRQRSARRRRK